MADLSMILNDPNFVNANAATKAAIFDKWAPQDPNFANANAVTQSAIREKFGISAPSQPAMPETPRPEPGVWQTVRKFAAPTIEALGAGGGALIGGGAGLLGGGPVGAAAGGVAGAGLGYGIAQEALKLGDIYFGGEAPRQGAAQIIEPARNILVGATMETGGRVAAPLIAKGVGKLMDLRRIPQNKAADIARNALGPDLEEAKNMLRAAQGADVSAAQATADINSPTWQALIDRVSKRDPRFLAALEKSQGEVSLNALSRLAGGTTAAETRGAAEAAKETVRGVTTPLREAALNRANLGKEVARLEGLSAELGDQAAAKVQEVRRLMELGDIAAASARLNLIKKGLPVGFEKYTYSGSLAERAFNDWSNKAAQASLDLGQGARFADEAAGALRAVGIKPLKGESVVSALSTAAKNPEFAANDLLLGSLKNVSDDIAKWTSSGGVIDARALDAIRKNSVNATIRQIMPTADATAQRQAAAGVLSKIKPVIDDAIEAAGGVGYKEYLAQHAAMMGKVAEQQLAGEALQLWKTNKPAFVQLVQNESPDIVERILGPGKYNIAVELSDSAMATLRDEAKKVLTDVAVKKQATEGQTALAELLKQNISKIKIPWGLSAKGAAVNKTLDILENKLGSKTMSVLTEALKKPETAKDLLNSVPAAERSMVLQVISNPAVLTTQGARQAAELIRTGTFNMLAPENKNALSQ